MAASAGDIVVTARRRAEDLSKVPISVSAFSGETLERKSVLSVLDLTKITPGLNISASASLANPFITIRGQSRGLAGPGTPGVLSYFNEVPLPATGSLIPTFEDRKSTRLIQSLMRISYAVFCFKKKNIQKRTRLEH